MSNKEINILTNDDSTDPKNLRLGWKIYENDGSFKLPSEDDSCYKYDIADKFRDRCGQDVDELTPIWSVVPQLEFLWGQPWNNLALNYVMALRPSSIRVTDGGITLDCHTWRVTVFLEKDSRTIKKIEQECSTGNIGADCGQDLQLKLKQQVTGEKIKQFDPSSVMINEYALAKIVIKEGDKI